MPVSTPNRLIHEKSPYLQQHAFNPVDWHPWGPEALSRARTENKPVLLSIGYSTCHWCHVMEHESFSDQTIATLMNRHFICIKVDREERPDLDKIYITAVAAMTGSAGWPLNVFLTPEGHLFYGGAYFPPTARPGAPGWTDVLQTIADHWSQPERQDRLLSSGHEMTTSLQKHLTWKNADGAGAKQLPRLALQRLRSAYDPENGGFSPAPKFPSPSLLHFLLAYSRMTNDPGPGNSTRTTRHMLTHTLNAMARGGIFDHLGGGFHRYATDAGWQVPHFEKMLYDNGQLLSIYLQAHRLTGSETYAYVARRTADYVLRDLQHPDGGFFAAEDADSRPPDDPPTAQKKEGAYFTWRLAEIESIIAEDSAIFSYHFGLRPEGNAAYDPHHEFDGVNIPHQVHTHSETAGHFQQRPEKITSLLENAVTKLLAVRNQRPRPHRDEKILTAWNGLMISGLAQAYQGLGDDRYLKAACRGADFILEHLYDAARQTLYRSWCDGERQIPGVADDYVFLAQAFLDLYEADFQHHWLKKALQFTDMAIQLFYDAETGGFFLTRPDHDPDLILRVKEDTDSVIPSGSSVAALSLLRLARLTGREDLQRMADKTIQGVLTRVAAHPEAAAGMLLAQLYQQSPLIQIAITGAWEHPETQAMIHSARPGRGDGHVVAWIGDDAHRRHAAEDIPFVERALPLSGKPAAYVCINRSCREPLTRSTALAALLADTTTRSSRG